MKKFLGVAAALALTACENQSSLVQGAACEATSSVALEPSPGTRALRAAGQNVYHPGPAPAAFAAASAPALLEAMDVDLGFVTSSTYVGNPTQSATFPDLGPITPTEGASFAWLSTGVAGAGTTRSVDPNATGTQEGTDYFNLCNFDGQNLEFDCVELTFTFTVPEGMNSVRFDFQFLSSEFPEYVNAGYNDEFKVKMSSPSHSYENIVFDDDGSMVNIDSAFFDQPCAQLAGTGFDIEDTAGQCDAGGTGPLSTIAPVEPGETVTLSFQLRDRGDGLYDSAVAIDNLAVRASTVEEPETDPCD